MWGKGRKGGEKSKGVTVCVIGREKWEIRLSTPVNEKIRSLVNKLFRSPKNLKVRVHSDQALRLPMVLFSQQNTPFYPYYLPYLMVLLPLRRPLVVSLRRSFSATTSAASSPLSISLEDRYCAKTYSPLPFVISKAKGCMTWSPEGDPRMDFLSAFSAANQGHAHPVRY